MAKDLFEKLDRERDSNLSNLKQAQHRTELLQAQVSDLEFELDSMTERCDHYRSHFELTKQESCRIEQESKNQREQAILTSTASEKQLSKL